MAFLTWCLFVISNIIANKKRKKKKNELEKDHLHPSLSAAKALKRLRASISSLPQGCEIQPENMKKNERSAN